MTIIVKQVGYTTVSGDPQNLVDGNPSTGWTPAAQAPSSGFANGFIQFDFQTPVLLASFSALFANPNSFGNGLLVCSDFDATVSPFNAVHDGDQVFAGISGSILGSGATLPIAGQTRPRRFFRLIGGADPTTGATDGTELFEFTFNPGSGGGGGSAVTWNPADKANTIALSGSNLTASCTSSTGSCVRATLSRITGKFYVEFQNITSQSNNDFLGFATSAMGLGNTNAGVAGLIDQVEAGTFACVTGSFYFPPVPQLAAFNGHTLGVAVDLDVGLVWFRVDNGPWNNVATHDPVSGAGGFPGNSGVRGPFNVALFPVVSFQVAGNKVTGAFSAASLLFPVPAGFLAWDGTVPHGFTNVAWSPTDKSTQIVLSNANHTSSLPQATGGNFGGRGTPPARGFGSGKWYLEFPVVNLQHGSGDGGSIGFFGTATAITGGPDVDTGVSPSGALFCINSAGGSGSPITTSINGHVVSFAVDLINKNIWVRLDGGVWNGHLFGVAADPATNTNGVSLATLPVPIVPGVHFKNASGTSVGTLTLNAGDSPFLFDVPAGFTAWDGSSSSPVVNLSSAFSDGDDDALTATVIVDASLSATLADGDSDALTATATITSSSDLSAAFTDGDSDALGIFIPRVAPIQISLMTTGR